MDIKTMQKTLEQIDERLKRLEGRCASRVPSALFPLKNIMDKQKRRHSKILHRTAGALNNVLKKDADVLQDDLRQEWSAR